VWLAPTIDLIHYLIVHRLLMPYLELKHDYFHPNLNLLIDPIIAMVVKESNQDIEDLNYTNCY